MIKNPAAQRCRGNDIFLAVALGVGKSIEDQGSPSAMTMLLTSKRNTACWDADIGGPQYVA